MRFLNNLHIKILAFVSAIILWFLIITVESNITKYPELIQLNVKNLQEGLVIEKNIPGISVFLKMDADQTRRMNANDFDIFVDASGLGEGTHLLTVEAFVNEGKSGILKVEPAEVSINLVGRMEKEVPIELFVEGKPDSKYKVAGSKTTPEKIKITGRKDAIEKIDTLQVNLKLNGTETDSFEKKLAVDVGGDIQASPAEVNASVTIESEFTEKEVSITPDFIRQDDLAAYIDKLTITPGKVIIVGKKDLVEKIDTVKTSPLEVTALIRNKSVQAKLELPANIDLKDPTQKITVNLK